MDRLTQKCSTIMISIGDETKVFHSVDDIPPKLREKLLETTVSAKTLLIADAGGREEILAAIRASCADRFVPPAGGASPESPNPFRMTRRFVLTWGGLARLLVLGSLAYILWVLISLR